MQQYPSTSLTSNTSRVSHLAKQIEAAHQQSLEHATNALSAAIKAGELLIEARSTLQHGEFQNWLTENVSFSFRTAQRYIRVSQNRELIRAKADKNAAALSVRGAMKLLSSPSKEKPAQPKRSIEVPQGMDPKPFAHFQEFTVLGHDPRHEKFINKLMRPWMLKGYIPLIDFHEDLGYVWHSMTTPDHKKSVKAISILFNRAEGDQQLLEDAEAKIEGQTDEFYRVAMALKTIRDERLWREDFPSWSAYCWDRINQDAAWVDDVISMAEIGLAAVAQNLTEAN